MATKVKCSMCGAKNALDAPRCRVCTTAINPHASADGVTPHSPSDPAPRLHSGIIDRRLAQARSRFASIGSATGLSARIAAANGGEMPQSVFGAHQTPVGHGVEASSPPPGTPTTHARAEPLPPSAAASTPGSSAHPRDEDEPFDADALFRDMRASS